MSQPTLVIKTVYLHDREREAAVEFGNLLYAHLTRPPNDPLSYGAGVPVLAGVAPDHVDPDAAETVILVPVLGKTSFQTQRDRVLEHMQAWHEALGPGHLLPLPTSEAWRNAESGMPGKPLLTMLYGDGNRERSTLDEIVLAVSRLLAGSDDAHQLFISHAKRDLENTGDAARRIHRHMVTNSTGMAFFDTTDLVSGRSLADQIDRSVAGGVLVVIRGDAYSSRAWCQQELFTAKEHGLPTLTVEVLSEGEQRSSPYGGNGPCMTWQDDPGAVASRAMVEWLRAARFERLGRRLVDSVGLPGDTRVLSRPPELLDFAQGPLERGRAQLVLHPDPELSVQERQILASAYPRLQLATPTTVFRRLLGRDTVAAPLEGQQIAMSLSDNPDVGGPDGYTANHFHDATVYIARSLISAGAGIAYGGDFRKGGFTDLLSELISGYNQTAQEDGDYLHSYLAAPIDPGDAPDAPITLHSLADGDDVGADALLGASDEAAGPLFFSDMRRVMALYTDARIVMGGAAEPGPAGPGGYGGRYPGIVEEAWRTLEGGKPLYVLGGLGGAAALVAALLREGDRIPERLRDETWMGNAEFKERAAKIDDDPWRERLGLPRRMEDLAAQLRTLGGPNLASDDAALAWNGLTIAENEALFSARDPVLLASLVLKGLLNVNRAQGEGKLPVELNLGSVAHATALDVIAVATFDSMPLGGAGAALDHALGGEASRGQAAGRSLIAMTAPEFDADWLYLASLGPVANATNIAAAIEKAASDTVQRARRYGLGRIGIVTFGGSVTATDTAAAAMLRGLDGLAGHGCISWFETDPERFEALRKTLAADEGIALTTRKLECKNAPQAPATADTLILHVTHGRGLLSTTVMPPAGTGVVDARRKRLSAADLARFGESGGPTPPLATLEERGRKLARLLLGDKAGKLLAMTGDAGITVIHDPPSSSLPFELLATDAQRPAIEGGIVRRLALREVPVSRLFAPPPVSDKVRVALIVNPTGDLPGAVLEAKAVRRELEQHADKIELYVLGHRGERDATPEAVLEALRNCDVLHYCGHAFFDGPGNDQSGLLLAGRETLTVSDMRGLSTVPRMVFFNACEAGRVGGSFDTEASAFAELILRCGVEAYVGTFWDVGDGPAAAFATGVYTRLMAGEDLESAVTESRAALHERNSPDWANYLLFGEGRFTLVRPSAADPAEFGIGYEFVDVE